MRRQDPSTEPCYPGLDNVGYGTGQGLAGYGLGDAVVRRDHIAALDPATGRALEWSPGSNSFEGNKAMEATARGLFAGGDANIQGGQKAGRVAFYDFNSLPAPSTTDTAITAPIMGRVIPAGTAFSINGTATSPSERHAGQGPGQGHVTPAAGCTPTAPGAASFAFNATLSGTGANRTWTLPLNITGNARDHGDAHGRSAQTATRHQQGDEEDRDVLLRRPVADHVDQRPVRHPDRARRSR